jgi:hypothetical protein
MEQPSEPNNDRPATNRPGAGWGDLDSEYRARGEDTPQDPTLPRSGFSWRFVKTGEPPDDLRVRYAMPVLILWVMLSGFLRGFVPWLVLGFALAIYALSARTAFRRYGLAGRGWVLTAMGIGQMLLSFALVLNVDLIWPLVGLYWVGVLLAWAVVELRGLSGLWR